MKTQRSNLNSHISLLASALLAVGITARAAEQPTLKDAYKDYFYVGVAINRTIATDTAVLADNVNRTIDEVRQDKTVVLEQFNQIAPENDLKWQLIHPRPGPDGYEFGPADAFVEFGVKNNLYLIGHTLVWHGQTPGWVFQGTNPPPVTTNAVMAAMTTTNAAGTNAPGGRRVGRGQGGGPGRFTGPRASREELLARMREHIHTVAGRYKGKIKVWDVVNEAIADGGTNVLRNSLWVEIIGPDFIAKAFEYAHEADPNAILRYNDYGLENPGKRRKLIALIKELQAQKVPVHAIGTQAHLSVSSPSFAGMDEALTEMASLGLPIHVTELDINSAQGRATFDECGNLRECRHDAGWSGGRRQQAAGRAVRQHVQGVFEAQGFGENGHTVGVNDAVSWRANGKPLLFDGRNQPKAAFDAVIRVALEAKQKATQQSASTQP